VIPGLLPTFAAAKAAKPAVPEADFALAELDAADGKLDDALKRLSEVVASHPDNKTGHLLLAQFEMTTGKTPAAIEQYRNKWWRWTAKTSWRSMRWPTCLLKASSRMKP
jgi:predicted Zn-dependent protease